MENQSTEDLPDECWEMVLDRLDHHSHSEFPSRVCKRFLSFTDHLRRHLTVVDPTIQIHSSISNLLRRFQNLVLVDLSKFTGNANPIVLEIARSSLSNLETLDISNQVSIPLEGVKELGLRKRSLKVLRCAHLHMLPDRDLSALANSLSFLEELDISYPNSSLRTELDPSDLTSMEVTDTGMEAVCSNIKNLLMIDISGNHFVTDKSIVALSVNCLKLKEVHYRDCSCVTQNGVHFMLENSPDISVVSVCNVRVPPESPLLGESLKIGRGLCSLEFNVSWLSDEYLYAIANAGLPLKRFTLYCCIGFSISGISSIPVAYQSLEYFALVDVLFLTDQSMIGLSQYLGNLTAIKLNLCHNLTSLTFFALAKNCPLLQEIEIEESTVGQDVCSTEFVENTQVKTLKLGRNPHMGDEGLKKIASVTPNLEFLDVSYCQGITGSSIAEISKSCLNIKHVCFSDCGRVTELGSDIKFHKLEVLDATRSGLGDEALVNIAKTCKELLKLDLVSCEYVGTKGVEEVVDNCKKLREINLQFCNNVTFKCNWVFCSRPMLKKIILPSFTYITENEYRFLLHHGCQISER